jgi:hypothetical protein
MSRAKIIRALINIAHLSLPAAGELFIPVYKTGYSSSKFA